MKYQITFLSVRSKYYVLKQQTNKILNRFKTTTYRIMHLAHYF